MRLVIHYSFHFVSLLHPLVHLAYHSNVQEYHGYLHKRQALLCVIPMSCGTMTIIGLKQTNRAKPSTWTSCTYLIRRKSIFRFMSLFLCSYLYLLCKIDVFKLCDITFTLISRYFSSCNYPRFRSVPHICACFFLLSTFSHLDWWHYGYRPIGDVGQTYKLKLQMWISLVFKHHAIEVYRGRGRNSVCSIPRHYLNVSGQLHASTVLTG